VTSRRTCDSRDATPQIVQGDAEAAVLRIARIDPHDPIGVVEGEAPKQHGIDQGEHGACGADAEGERGDRGQREAAVFHEATSRETKILDDAAIGRLLAAGRKGPSVSILGPSD
jgi:hypothetical protein